MSKVATTKKPKPEAIDFESAATDQPKGDVQRAVEMGQAMLRAENRVQELEAELKQAQAEYALYERELLPDLMAEVGLKKFEMPDGSTFDLTEDVNVGISEERRPAAHAWLDQHGFGGLVKSQLVVAFGKDEKDSSERVEFMLTEAGYPPERKESIHAATLKSFVKEQLEKGAKLPFELFGINPFNRVKFKQAKAKKARA